MKSHQYLITKISMVVVLTSLLVGSLVTGDLLLMLMVLMVITMTLLELSRQTVP
jgi:hypothetical protein